MTRVRLFVIHQNEKAMETLLRRYSRPSDVYREKILQKVFKKLKIEPYNGIRWSQKAGCICGCSPGFILDIVPYCVGYDAIWVTVK